MICGWCKSYQWTNFKFYSILLHTNVHLFSRQLLSRLLTQGIIIIIHWFVWISDFILIAIITIFWLLLLSSLLHIFVIVGYLLGVFNQKSLYSIHGVDCSYSTLHPRQYHVFLDSLSLPLNQSIEFFFNCSRDWTHHCRVTWIR